MCDFDELLSRILKHIRPQRHLLHYTDEKIYDVEAKCAVEMVTQRCADAGREISLLWEVGGFSEGVVGRSEGRERESEQEGWRKKVWARASVFLWLKLKGKTRE